MIELLLKDEVYAVVGAAMAVYNELGSGFLEAVYHEALEIELTQRQIPFQSYVSLTITYQGRELRKRYEADIITYGELIVELKATKRLTSLDQAQLLNYLKAFGPSAGRRVGILINFGSHPNLEWKRMIK